MVIRPGGFAGFVVQPDNAETAARRKRARRKPPFHEIRVGIREIEIRQHEVAALGIVQLEPRLALVHVVADTADVGRLQLVDPQQRKCRERPAHAVRRARRVEHIRIRSPIADAIAVPPIVNQLQRRPAARSRRGPRRRTVVDHLVHDHFVRALGPQQLQPLADIIQFARILAHHRIQVGVHSRKRRAILNEQHKSAGGNHRTLLKGEIQAGHAIARKIEGVIGGSIMQFQELREVVRRLVHDLVDHQRSLGRRVAARIRNIDRHGCADLLPILVEPRYNDIVDAGCDGEHQRPVGHRAPSDRIFDPVENQCVNLDGGHTGKRDSIAVRRDTADRQAEIRHRIQLAQNIAAAIANPTLGRAGPIRCNALRAQSVVGFVHHRMYPR